jgi:hypothetical protein
MRREETTPTLLTELDVVTDWYLSWELTFFKLHERLKFVAVHEQNNIVCEKQSPSVKTLKVSQAYSESMGGLKKN